MTQTSFRLTDKQKEANKLLGGSATHCLLEGGSRSGKTFVATRAVLIRAAAKSKTNHGIFRFRFNHLKSSIIYGTLPKVIELSLPELQGACKLDKQDWFFELPNKSRIWFGGLDDKERTEKILGNEYSTILLNEISQIPYSSAEMAITRLAENNGLRLKAYYDQNPGLTSHWSHRQWHKLRDARTNNALKRPEDYAHILMNPRDNLANLPAAYIKQLEGLSVRARKRFLDGLYGDANENALWTVEGIEASRSYDLPDMQRVVVAVDPSGCSGDEDSRSDEVGIVVVGLGTDQHCYVLEDLSGRYSPPEWAKVSTSAYHRHKADRIVAEVNYGGAMVESTIRAADDSVGVTKLTASRGKVVRAEPVAVLTEQDKLHLNGTFPELEEQMIAMTTNGYMGDKSPDRLDAMVWGVSFLFPSAQPEDDFDDDFDDDLGLGWMH